MVSIITNFFTLSLILAAVAFLANGQENGLEKFLTEKMLKYPEWLKSRGDPTKPGPGGYTFTDEHTTWHVNISADLRNFYVSGHSVNQDPPEEIGGDLDTNSFYIVRNASMVLGGTYTATGKVEASSSRIIPFSGQGKFKIGGDKPSIRDYEVIEINNFAVIDEHISLEAATIRFDFNQPVGYEVLEFEGLLDDPEVSPYKQNILETILTKVRNSEGRLNASHPSRFLLIEYLEDIFSKNTYEEIKAWP